MKQETVFDLSPEKQGFYQITCQFFTAVTRLNPCNFKGFQVCRLTKSLTNSHTLNTSLNVDTA